MGWVSIDNCFQKCDWEQEVRESVEGGGGRAVFKVEGTSISKMLLWFELINISRLKNSQIMLFLY